MEIEALIKKFLETKYKLFMKKPIEYDIDSALEILEDDYYEDIDLLIWVHNENEDKPTFFETKEDAIYYINDMNPENICIEFSYYILIEEATNDLIDYINETEEISDETKIKIINFLIDDYIKEYDDGNEEIELLNYINDLPDNELLDTMQKNEELFNKILTNFTISIEDENKILFIEPNYDFYEEKNIRFIKEVCEEFLINFHNYNFINGSLDNSSINLIYNYLCSKFSLNEEYYEYYFGENFYNKEKLNRLLTLMVISTYYRLTYLKKNEKDYLNKDDIQYLNLIDNSTLQQILLEFELNENFGKCVVSDYLYFNNYYDSKDIKDEKAYKTLKKIDPFYPLNK